MATTSKTRRGGNGHALPTDRLRSEFQNLLGAVRDRTLTSMKDKVGEAAGRLTDYVDSGGGPGLMAAVTGTQKLAEGRSPARAFLSAGMAGAKGNLKNLFGRGKGAGGQGKKLKVTNIVESIDVGVPVRMAYNQWTQFRDFPSFMKKVETVEQAADEKLNWKAQIFWSHRTWESTILQQMPDEKIVWRSKGAKGHVDGAVTFHEVTPDLTRILLVLEYNPKGLFEHTGNMWRAQGRRARLELKHFRRYVMTQSILRPGEIEGWRGVIEDSKVVKDHETALREEQEQGRAGEEFEGEEPEDELPEGEEGEAPEDELPEGEEPEDELPTDEKGEEPTAEDEGGEPGPGDYEDEEGQEYEGDGQAARPVRRRRDAGEGRPQTRRSPAARARRTRA